MTIARWPSANGAKKWQNQQFLQIQRQTSILKVLHGNTKSPTGHMYSWRYNILYLTILYNIRNVFVFVCIAFKNVGD